MAAIDQLDDLAQAHGYADMWQAKEAIWYGKVLNEDQIDAFNDAFGAYIKAEIESGDTTNARRGMENAMEAIHVGQPNLATTLVANWKTSDRYNQ